jgi:hypothetical protein
MLVLFVTVLPELLTLLLERFTRISMSMYMPHCCVSDRGLVYAVLVLMCNRVCTLQYTSQTALAAPQIINLCSSTSHLSLLSLPF